MNSDDNRQSRGFELAELARHHAREYVRKRMRLEKMTLFMELEQEVFTLSDNMQSHIMETTRKNVLALYCAEKNVLAQAQAERDAGKISEQDFRRRLASIKMNVDILAWDIREKARVACKNTHKCCMALLQRRANVMSFGFKQTLPSSLYEDGNPLKPTIH